MTEHTDNPADEMKPWPTFSLRQVFSLARKELKETLRDRRTVTTLLLMPMLLYPLMSIVFQKFLFSQFSEATRTDHAVGVLSEDEGRQIMAVIGQGRNILLEKEETKRQAEGDKKPVKETTFQARLRMNRYPELQFHVVEDFEKAIDEKRVVLGLTLADETESDYGDTIGIVYQKGSLAGENVRAYVRRCLTAINDRDRRDRLLAAGDDRGDLARWAETAITIAAPPLVTMASMVPLMLVLMTSTGAVYPAIDLTAGERERGTLEILVAAPISRLALLLGKYLAVLTVAMLTAVLNLVGMFITLKTSALGSMLIPADAFTIWSGLAILSLLLLFASFFSSLVLMVTSFARSFKEAQMYLIPLMLISMAPGMMSLAPGINLEGVWTITPLLNTVLLSRDVLQGDVTLIPTLLVVGSTLFYALLGLTAATYLFGTDAILYGGAERWSSVFFRPANPSPNPAFSTGLLTLAFTVPALFVVGPLLLPLLGGASMNLAEAMGIAQETGVKQTVDIGPALIKSSALNFLLFLIVPLTLAWYYRFNFVNTFSLRLPRLIWLLVACLFGVSISPFLVEFLLQFPPPYLEQFKGVAEFIEIKLPDLPLLLVLMAVLPAIVEEVFFRGFLLSALRDRGKLSDTGAILLSALIFGLFHISVHGGLMLERLPISMVLGILMGWLCVRSGSLLPGIVFHMLHNGLTVAGSKLGEGLIREDSITHVPIPLLAVAACFLVAAAFLAWKLRQRPIPEAI